MKMRVYGPWLFDPKGLTLVHDNGYEIDVERWVTSAQVLDWIFQIKSKTWADPMTVATLVSAIEDIINPQQNLCSFGKEKGPIDVRKTIDKLSTKELRHGP